MPCERAVYAWRHKHAVFAQMYAIARTSWTHSKVEEIIGIAADGSDDYITKENEDGSTYEALNPENISRSRLVVDTMKWALSKFNKSTFGESSAIDVNLSALPPPDPKELAAEIKSIILSTRQKMLEAAPAGVSEAVYVEIPEDGSDLC